MSQLYTPSGNTVSQIQIGNDSNKIYNIIDISTRRTVADLCDQVNGIPTIKKLSTSASDTLKNAGINTEEEEYWKLEGEVYQIGHLVTGSLLLKDSKAIIRDNINYNYTLINNLPKPSTDIIFKCTTDVKGTAFLKLQHLDGYLK